MKDRPLMSVTQVLDDETGIWAGDLCEFSIHCADLEDFLRAHGEAGAKEICDTLEHLKKATHEYLDRVRDSSNATLTGPKQPGKGSP